MVSVSLKSLGLSKDPKDAQRRLMGPFRRGLLTVKQDFVRVIGGGGDDPDGLDGDGGVERNSC
jgi:hypothetical protein